MRAGFEGMVESVISSTGSMSPRPKTFFHIRLAMTVVKRGFSGLVIQSAKASTRVWPSLGLASWPKRARASMVSPGLALSYL